MTLAGLYDPRMPSPLHNRFGFEIGHRHHHAWALYQAHHHLAEARFHRIASRDSWRTPDQASARLRYAKQHLDQAAHWRQVYLARTTPADVQPDWIARHLTAKETA